MTVSTTTSPDSVQSAPKGNARLDVSGNDAAKLLAWVNKEYTRTKNARTFNERQWYQNLAFFFGRQNVALMTTTASTNGFKLYTPKAPPWRVRMVINKTRPMVRKEIAKITAQKPRFDVVPRTSDEEDITAARAAETIFDSLYYTLDLPGELRDAVWWSCITGNGYLKTYWDDGAVDKINQLKGSIVLEEISPFHIFVPDLMEKDIEGQPYVIHALTKDPEWIELNYGFTPNPDTIAAGDILEDSFLNVIGAKQTKPNQVLIREVWVKPGSVAAFKDGGIITVVGDRVVQAHRGYPYAHGEFPFAKIDHIPSGKFYSDSVVTDFIPLQKEYNRTRSQIIEAKNRMGKPQLLAQEGSIQPQKINTEAGQVILYKPGYSPPTPLQLQPLPSYILDEVKQLQADMDDVSGQHDISRGQNPAQVTAATALSFLQEQDDTMITDTISSVEKAVEKVGRQVLSHVSQYWDTPRLIQITGKDGAFDAQTYKGADLKGCNDVRVEAGSALPTSKAAKQAFLMDLAKMGFLPPEKLFEMLEIGGVDKLYEDTLIDVRQAQRENLRMSQVQPPPIDPMAAVSAAMGQPAPSPQPTEPSVSVHNYDNHQMHIMIHNKFRKTQEFELLNPAAQQEFEMHVQLHQQALATPMPGQPMGPSMMSGQAAPVEAGQGASAVATGGVPQGVPDSIPGQPAPTMGGQ